MEIELRKLIKEQRKIIEKGARFVYETDVFADGIRVFKSNNNLMFIGKWIVKFDGETAEANILKHFGGSSAFETENINVEFIKNWKAYRRQGVIGYREMKIIPASQIQFT